MGKESFLQPFGHALELWMPLMTICTYAITLLAGHMDILLMRFWFAGTVLYVPSGNCTIGVMVTVVVRLRCCGVMVVNHAITIINIKWVAEFIGNNRAIRHLTLSDFSNATVRV